MVIAQGRLLALHPLVTFVVSKAFKPGQSGKISPAGGRSVYASF
jgi:hypothetical protein